MANSSGHYNVLLMLLMVTRVVSFKQLWLYVSTENFVLIVYSNVLVPLVVAEVVKSSVTIDNIQLNGQSTTLTLPR